MGDRHAQEFWDQMWLWEKYETFPSETVDDPHLVVGLSSDVDQAGDNVDPVLFARYDNCVGRVLQRLTDLFPRTANDLDGAELKLWLAFGLRADVRGHGEEETPIIDANSLVVFRFFVTHALRYAERHGRNDLVDLWRQVKVIAEEVDAEHQGSRPSRFGAVKLA